jgi:hypothetical protein
MMRIAAQCSDTTLFKDHGSSPDFGICSTADLLTKSSRQAKKFKQDIDYKIVFVSRQNRNSYRFYRGFAPVKPAL